MHFLFDIEVQVKISFHFPLPLPLPSAQLVRQQIRGELSIIELYSVTTAAAVVKILFSLGSYISGLSSLDAA